MRPMVQLTLALQVILAAAAGPAFAQSAAAPPMTTLPCSAAVSAVGIGFTFTHIGAHPDSCQAETPQSPISPANNIILNYDKPEVAAEVRADLGAMKDQGATAMRVVFWFFDAEDTPFAPRAPGLPIGIARAEGGMVSPTLIGNLRAYLQDAHAAGYRRAYVVIGAQGRSDPSCRIGTDEWGGCFNAALIPLNWSVARQVIAGVRTEEAPDFHIVFDIAPEDCFDADSSRLADTNKTQLTTTMVTNYRDTFHDSNFMVSCAVADGMLPRVGREFTSLLNLFSSLGVTPDAIDIHDYVKDPDGAADILQTTNQVAASIHVPMIVGETWYNHANIFPTIARLRGDGQLHQLRDVLIWPGEETITCHPNIDLPAPFDIGAVRAQMCR